ncbi:hypothetical protein GGR21_000893 [Dysgonomonas hofstadii]|uniref:Uncharacterized protein n=1 Tax=Dysgonomonas hofstadii TaxID=637886 RepID=A0A840CI76_9BACT|nr:hypothetical protein [Dysgonomonas hofstadii]MBB4035006.1 hypothetical protein [Dysgonomonas hofstadii]
MTKTYTIETTRETKTEACYSFNMQDDDVKYNSAYNEILRIFREAFSLVDMSVILKKK